MSASSFVGWIENCTKTSLRTRQQTDAITVSETRAPGLRAIALAFSPLLLIFIYERGVLLLGLFRALPKALFDLLFPKTLSDVVVGRHHLQPRRRYLFWRVAHGEPIELANLAKLYLREAKIARDPPLDWIALRSDGTEVILYRWRQSETAKAAQRQAAEWLQRSDWAHAPIERPLVTPTSLARPNSLSVRRSGGTSILTWGNVGVDWSVWVQSTLGMVLSALLAYGEASGSWPTEPFFALLFWLSVPLWLGTASLTMAASFYFRMFRLAPTLRLDEKGIWQIPTKPEGEEESPLTQDRLVIAWDRIERLAVRPSGAANVFQVVAFALDGEIELIGQYLSEGDATGLLAQLEEEHQLVKRVD